MTAVLHTLFVLSAPSTHLCKESSSVPLKQLHLQGHLQVVSIAKRHKELSVIMEVTQFRKELKSNSFILAFLG